MRYLGPLLGSVAALPVSRFTVSEEPPTLRSSGLASRKQGDPPKSPDAGPKDAPAVLAEPGDAAGGESGAEEPDASASVASAIDGAQADAGGLMPQGTEEAALLLGMELETRATLFNTHTAEATALSSTEPTHERFSNLLSDRVTGTSVPLDPRLLGLLRDIVRDYTGVRVEIVSGYRSPKLNEMLRKKGHHVASHSQHSLGHAVDFRVVGLSPDQVKKELIRLNWEGGIGQYNSSSDLFVHADVGPKRQWYGR